MNTFLPYADFPACARVLDRQRLGKQRVEVLQLVQAIRDPKSKGWQNHPCTNMWRLHLPALVEYGLDICREWMYRGYSDSVLESLLPLRDTVVLPPWLGSPKLHASHRANLLRKDPKHYGEFGWVEQPIDGYFWPKPTYNWRHFEFSNSRKP